MFIKNHIKLFLVGICLVVIAVGSFLTFYLFLNDKDTDEPDIISYVETTTTVSSTIVTENYFYVDIKGCVVNPGVYQVTENNIVKDVIDMAGGLKKNAYTNNINLSMKVKPEMVIIVYNKNEVTSNSGSIKNVTNDASIVTTTISSKSSKSESNVVVNINTASLEELQTIPGIGEGKAKKIIEYRNDNKFNTIEDIKNVSGIGDSLFEQIKNHITV